MASFTKIEGASNPEQLSGGAPYNKSLLKKFEINCDMGEGFGPWRMGPDEDIMPLIDRANIACGGHASDPSTMLKTVKLAQKYNVDIGAHPGLPDKEGFGRRVFLISPDDIYTMVLCQVGALKAICDSVGAKLTHIKPHGELYFYMERDDDIKAAIIKAAKVFDLPLVAFKSAHYLDIATKSDQPFIQEAYPDLHLSPEGKLVKIKAGPKLARTPDDIYECVKRAGLTGQFIDTEGGAVDLGFGDAPITFCLHSDMPDAIGNVRLARKAVDEVNEALGLV